MLGAYLQMNFLSSTPEIVEKTKADLWMIEINELSK